MQRKIIPYNPRLKEFAKRMRNNSTQAEIKLWMHLRQKKMRGYDFHRQKPIDEYILDFFCNELMLEIEVDGYTHLLEETQKKDEKKEKSMNSLGITVLRFTDDEVFKVIDKVLLAINNYIGAFEKQNRFNNSLSFFKREINNNTPLPFLSVSKQQHTSALSRGEKK